MQKYFLWPVFITLTFCTLPTRGQQIIDPCFKSVKEIGFFFGSEDIKNTCNCDNDYLASDMMIWNGTAWDGVVKYNTIDTPPPPGCNQRAMWLGYSGWTRNGEGIALRLDKAIESGKTYTYTFTYVSDGNGRNGNFAPRVYTHSQFDIVGAFRTGNLPGVGYEWGTNSYSFTAQPAQNGHTWLILFAVESSGMILGQCDVQKLFPEENLLGDDRLLCMGDSTLLTPPINSNYTYVWNTGSTSSSIYASQPGSYEVTIQYGSCFASSTVDIETEDCEVRLVMPNIFTPNGDVHNPLFVPKEHNYIENGTTRIYNRWGNHIYTGDLFTGWNGATASGSDVSNGVYYFVIYYKGKNGKSYELHGPLTVTR